MVCLRTVTGLSPTQQRAVLGYLARASAHHGSSLDDHLRLDLANGPRPGFVGAIAIADGADNSSSSSNGNDNDNDNGNSNGNDGGWPDEGGVIVGYAQGSAGNDGMVIDGIAADAALRQQLLQAIVRDLPADTAITWWAEPGAASAAVAATLGMQADRLLLHMRSPVPITGVTDVVVRPFLPGADEAEWLRVNNAAFQWHGEQGGWDLATLLQREHEPWFRPEGFLLHERDGRLAAFCWTKLHEEGELVGEIYVVAVHPDFHGLGLGRALTVAGLQHMQQVGATTAMLYVDSTNIGAVRLYESLGFTVAHTAQSFRRQPSGGPR